MGELKFDDVASLGNFYIPNKRIIKNKALEKVIISDTQGSCSRGSRTAWAYDKDGNKIKSTQFSPSEGTIFTQIYSGKNAGNTYYYDKKDHSSIIDNAKNNTETTQHQGQPPQVKVWKNPKAL